MRVLAADDDESMARTLERQLRGWGYEPVIAHSGHEAWCVLREPDAPRVVILDWDMPGMNGLEVCRLFRATSHGADAYVLVLTGRHHKEHLVEALESGVDDFLTKPFDTRELQLRLAKGVRDVSRKPSSSRVVPRGTPPPTGTTLGGRYRLERKIAQGGMGSVWQGVHLSLGINVAIKFMAQELAETADFASFEREARAAAQLRNPHIVRVYDHGISDEGLPYLVMEFLSGLSLAEDVERHGPMPLPQAVGIVDQVAQALGEAHVRGIVHRDVKPENILLVDGGEVSSGPSVKLIDFGLAHPAPASGTRSVGLAGTPSYMSPEVLLGDVDANPALDLWALATTAYYAVTGSVAFDAPSLSELFERVCAEPLPVPSAKNPTLPKSFDAWFEHACAREPEKRFATAGELATALHEACLSPAVSGARRVAAPVSESAKEPAQTEILEPVTRGRG